MVSWCTRETAILRNFCLENSMLQSRCSVHYWIWIYKLAVVLTKCRRGKLEVKSYLLSHPKKMKFFLNFTEKTVSRSSKNLAQGILR